MSDIYELSQFQYINLIKAANEGNIVFAVIDPPPNSSPEKIKELNKQKLDVLELIQLNLLKDVSKDFAEQIAVCKLNNGFSYMIVSLTRDSILMFSVHTERPVN